MAVLARSDSANSQSEHRPTRAPAQPPKATARAAETIDRQCVCWEPLFKTKLPGVLKRTTAAAPCALLKTADTNFNGWLEKDRGLRNMKQFQWQYIKN